MTGALDRQTYKYLIVELWADPAIVAEAGGDTQLHFLEVMVAYYDHLYDVAYDLAGHGGEEIGEEHPGWRNLQQVRRWLHRYEYERGYRPDPPPRIVDASIRKNW